MSNTVIEILIDNSGSMGYMKGGKHEEGKYLIDGQTRMSLIKELLINEIIPTINYSSELYIRTFRIAIEKKEILVVKKEIQIPTIYEGEFNQDRIIASINRLEDPPMGGTPITAAIEKSFENLKKYKNHDRKIILLTDGEENGGGDYIATAKKIEKLEGIKCKIFIIGIAQDAKSEKAAREIASGGYYNIKSKSFEKNEVKQVIAPIKTAVLKDTIQAIDYSKDKENNKTTFEVLQKKEAQVKEKIENIKKDAKTTLIIDSTTLSIDEEYSDIIRQKSESFLYKILCEKYGSNRINWLNKETESFKQYDFELLDENGEINQYIECKGTSRIKPTFYLSDKEWNFFINNHNYYQIYRIYNVDENCSYHCIGNLLNSLMTGDVIPYLTKPEILKENRVFLTLKKMV